MEPQIEKIIVLLIVLTASILTWKMVKDFYMTKFHKLFAHLIAVITSSFMLLSSMILFVPKNYQRGVGPEVEINFVGILTIVVMLVVLYIFFKYIPDNKNKS
ncbi:hypothetical protein [Arcobacter cloacae]|uniref:Uncharacterized protein n=1 Tax=Arcobacter cloacae TaxID=1054034 RepID=A0A6M8N8T9_9BACT|nr:hypothetical protein [Arcobacter cloacae]QKF90503.1 putative membrane protein [Arcobacter cloacae]RXI37934.1 hypothetical protein CP963_11815 [Arcobacter cloacae]